MRTIKELKARREDCRLKAIKIIEQAEKEDRELTEDENKEISKLEGELKGWDEQIVRVEIFQKPKEDKNESEGKAEENAEVLKDDPNKEETRKFRSLGEQMMAVYRASTPAGRKGITILFESQGIDTNDPTSRLALGIMATLAEEESRTISHNVSWGFQKRFEQGLYVAGGRVYGYNIEEGKFNVDIDKIDTINNIYQWFLNGCTLYEIKGKLEELQVPSPTGKNHWYISTIRSILTNEKYRGDLILQKTFKQDVLSQRKINNGERTKYKITKNHIPIVKPEMYDAVQVEMARREKQSKEPTNIGKYTNDYAFSSKIECAECVTKFRRHSQWSVDKTKKVPIWVCIKHQKHHNECSMKPIKEENLEIGFINALNQITARKNDIITKLKGNIESTIKRPGIDTILDLKARLKENQSKLLELNKQAVLQGNIKELEQQSQTLITEIHDIQEQLNIIKDNQDTVNIIDYRIKEIGKVLKTAYSEFNKDVFRTLIDKIIIKDKHRATYIFKCGIAVEQEI